jgi:hypothetical protein
MPRWYVRLPGEEPTGPFSTEAIAARVHQGALPPTVSVCPVGDQRWFTLETLPEFTLALKYVKNVRDGSPPERGLARNEIPTSP